MSLQKRLKFILFINIIFVYLLNIQVETAKTKAYMIENTRFFTWDAAVEHCKNLNMSLFSIESNEEFEYLKTVIKLKHELMFPYWLGARKTNGAFKWISTERDIKLFMWHDGEPNDVGGNEKCLHTTAENFAWNDIDCERELPFICEIEV